MDLDSYYMLSRDRPNEEWHRLNLQHRYFVDHIQDHRLIYDASVLLPRDAFILDLGCGTGIWMIDVAKTAPPNTQWTLYGVDVSWTQFSLSTDLPTNIFFKQASVISLPRSWDVSFDFVQLRMMHAALSDAEWPLALRETHRVLKHGGSMQLMAPMKPCGNTPAILRQADLFNRLFYAVGMDPDLSQKMPQLVRDAGFRDVRCDIRMVALNMKLAEGGEDGNVPSLATLLLAAVNRMKAKAIELGCVDSGEDFDDLLKKLEADWNVDDQPMYGYFVIVMAHK